MRQLLPYFLLLLFAASLGSTARAQPIPRGPVYGPVPVAAVTDGDTLIVASNAGPRTVRLTGIDAPERGQSPSQGAAYAAQATAFLSLLLPEGTPVWLELDAGETDTYGRLLAYVYVEDVRGEWLVGDRRAQQVNLLIADAGLASVLTVPPNDAYERLYRQAVERARREGVGMWAIQTAEGSPRDAPAPGAPTVGAAQGGGPDSAEPALPLTTHASRPPLSIRCALYNPETPNDEAGEWVSLLVEEPFDTSGYYLFDEGSNSVFLLPLGVQEPGELLVQNPGQGVWNNGGDVIYLKWAAAVVDSWRYTSGASQGSVVCRDDAR